jgi:hypothetical protein
MRGNMLHRAVCSALLTGLTAGLAACGGGGGSGTSSSSSGSGTPTPTQQSGVMPVVISDATSDDWATVGVKVLSIALVPQGGGTPVTVYTAPSPAPCINLEQLDQLGEILGNVSVPVGTYTSAILTVGANPGDVLLTVGANPESGFPVLPGTTIPSGQIQIQNAQGSPGDMTVGITVKLATALTVSTTSSNGLDLEFDLSHPAVIVGHTPPAADGLTIWAVNFQGPVRHHPVWNLTHLVLRHTYGTVGTINSAALPITKDFPVYPATNPETEINSSIALNINADSTYGTIVYDLDAGTRTVVESFASETSLQGKFVRVAARYQEDGTLTAVRVWASTDFAKVWLSPEGHVLNANATTDVLTIENEDGVGVQVMVNSATQVFYRTPTNAQADATPIGNGATMLTDQDLVRGFKVHVSAVDPLAVPLVAQTIDIETAAYSGSVSAASTSGLTYTHNYLNPADDYSVSLSYIASGTANGFNDSGDPISGFKWWDFTLPTTVDYGANAASDFVAATNGSVNFGGAVGAVAAWGYSTTMWGDGTTTNPSNWYLRDAILEPTPVPLGTVTIGYGNGTFTMTVLNGTLPVTVDVSTTTGLTTLVYQVDRSNGIVTVSPIDITTAAGMSALTSNVVNGTPVKVYGVPQAPVAPAAGTLQAYVLFYYTGTLPSM